MNYHTTARSSRSSTATRRRRLRLRALLTLSASFGFFAVWTSPASAAYVTDNLVPTTSYSPACRGSGPTVNATICLTDNSEVYYYMDSSGEFELEAEDRGVVDNNLDYEFRPTHLAFHYDSDPVFSGAGETDLIYQEGLVDSDFDGATWCNDAVDSATYRCDQSYVRIRGGGAYTINLACHETGHAMGLTHGDFASPYIANNDMRLGCMTTSSLTYDLGDNQVQNINSVY